MPTSCQLRRDHLAGVDEVVGEAAVRLAEPVGDGAGIVLPQDVGIAVAVEVAGAKDVPVGRDGLAGAGEVIAEAAVELAEPLGDHAFVAAPDQVFKVVAVEVAHPDDVPVEWDVLAGAGEVVAEAAVEIAEPFGDDPGIAAPDQVAQPVAVEVAGADDVPVRAGSPGRSWRSYRGRCRRAAQPLRHHAGIAAPHDVAQPVAVVVAGADDVPVERDRLAGVGAVVDEGAVRPGRARW